MSGLRLTSNVWAGYSPRLLRARYAPATRSPRLLRARYAPATRPLRARYSPSIFRTRTLLSLTNSEVVKT